MSEVTFVRRFQNLEVCELAKDIFEITKRFPKDECYSLTDQIRRSSRSIGGQIAEAWGKRRYERHFVSKLTDADGEQLETQHWLLTSLDCEYISKAEYKMLMRKSISIGRMLGTMILKANKFCNPNALMLHETSPKYDLELDGTEYRTPNTEYQISGELNEDN